MLAGHSSATLNQRVKCMTLALGDTTPMLLARAQSCVPQWYDHNASWCVLQLFRAPRGRIQPLSQMGQDLQAHDRKWLVVLTSSVLHPASSDAAAEVLRLCAEPCSRRGGCTTDVERGVGGQYPLTLLLLHAPSNTRSGACQRARACRRVTLQRAGGRLLEYSRAGCNTRRVWAEKPLRPPATPYRHRSLPVVPCLHNNPPNQRPSHPWLTTRKHCVS